MQLRIIVGDVNDNTPVCQGSPVVQLNKAAPVGTDVVTIEVTDLDEGVNSQIVFLNTRGQLASQFLTIEASTGIIRTSA